MREDRLRFPSWLYPVVLLGATACGVAFVLRGPTRAFGIALGASLAVVVGWILVSVLFPSTTHTVCPRCERTGLRRARSDTTRGVRCAHCGYEDADASSFLIAEEEPLEREHTLHAPDASPQEVERVRARAPHRADGAQRVS